MIRTNGAAILERPIIHDESTRPVVGRIDRLVFMVSATRSNVEYLAANFDHVLHKLALAFPGIADVPLRTRGPQKQVLQYEFLGAVSKLTLRFHYQLRQFHAKHKKFPTWEELFSTEFAGLWVLRIEITDRRKWNYAAHLENIHSALSILEPHLELDPNTLEISFDTHNPGLGMFIRKYACLYRPPADNQLFHCVNRGRIAGPSPDANNEYMGYRAKGWNDTRPISERPRGGRRQIHSYDREFHVTNDLTAKFYRFELRLYRSYLRDCTRRNDINTVRDLCDRIQELAEANLRFRKLDSARLYRDIPESRLLSLKPLSFKGQLYVLRHHGFTMQKLTRYIVKLPWPDIYYCLDPYDDSDRDEHGMALWYPITSTNFN